MKLALTPAIIFILCSCVSGPETEKKSALNYLSGKHYESTGNIIGVPLMKRRHVDTVISGHIIQSLPTGLPIALPHKILILEDKFGKEVSRLRSDSNGDFRFNLELKNGEYTIRLSSKKLKMKHPLTVKSYKYEGLQLIAVPKDSQ